MAGRKPRQTADEQAGVTPLRGPRSRSGLAEDGATFVPQFPGQRPPFPPGNQYALHHGAYSPQAIVLARALVSAVLEDPAMPGHLRSPAFRHSLEAWARLQTMADMIFPWMAELEIDEMTAPQGKIGNGKSRLELYLLAERQAANARSRLGLDPVSYAKIKKDLGIAANASEHQLEKLATAGAQITARRLAIEDGEDAPA